LNAKLARNSSLCQSLKEQFNNEDLERTNEIFNELTSKLEKCNADINAEKAAEDDDAISPNDIQLNVRDTNLSDSLKDNQMADSGSLQSLQARRKRIIKAINDMVQMFNENNKSVREASKAQKTEREVSELIDRNHSIIKTALGIDFSVQGCKTFADQIDKRLDVLCNPLVENLRRKYYEKNQLIDECDDVFDRCSTLIK
jgi:hypothetical protein